MRVAKKRLDPEEAMKQVEAVLFSSGRWMSSQEISRVCRIREEVVDEALKLLSEKYKSEDTALILMRDKKGDVEKWKLTVRSQYSEAVSRVVPQTELKKSVLETLAVIAWKAPVLQSDVIKIRTNKAYNDIDILEEEGFITKEKHGRTYLIKLSKKFFDYFEIEGRENLQELFAKIEEKRKEKEGVKEVEESIIINEGETENETMSRGKEEKDLNQEQTIIVIDGEKEEGEVENDVREEREEKEVKEKEERREEEQREEQEGDEEEAQGEAQEEEQGYNEIGQEQEEQGRVREREELRDEDREEYNKEEENIGRNDINGDNTIEDEYNNKKDDGEEEQEGEDFKEHEEEK